MTHLSACAVRCVQLEDALTGEPLTPHQVALLFELNKPDQKGERGTERGTHRPSCVCGICPRPPLVPSVPAGTPLPIYRPRQQMMDKGAAGRFTLTVDLNGDKVWVCTRCDAHTGADGHPLAHLDCVCLARLARHGVSTYIRGRCLLWMASTMSTCSSVSGGGTHRETDGHAHPHS